MADIQTQPPVQQAIQKPVATPVPSISAEKIHVTVRNRTLILFNEDVKSVTSRNETGLFDILPEHANFISIISSPLIIGKLDGSKKEINFHNGIIKVKDNAVYCYIDLLAPKPATPTKQIIPTAAKPIK